MKKGNRCHIIMNAGSVPVERNFMDGAAVSYQLIQQHPGKCYREN